MEEYIQIQWTAAHLDEARAISKDLLQRGYIACSSILPQVESIYYWDEEVVSEIEVKVLMKTVKQYYPLIRDIIEKDHSYEVPEILCFTILDGNMSYLKWVDKQLNS